MNLKRYSIYFLKGFFVTFISAIVSIVLFIIGNRFYNHPSSGLILLPPEIPTLIFVISFIICVFSYLSLKQTEIEDYKEKTLFLYLSSLSFLLVIFFIVYGIYQYDGILTVVSIFLPFLFAPIIPLFTDSINFFKNKKITALIM